MLSIAPLVLAAVLFAPTGEPFVEPFTETALLDAPTRRVRSADHSIRKLLKRGYRQSSAFRDLLTRLQRSDVYVYIEEVPRLPGALEGRMMILPKAHGHRYVRIQVALRGSTDDGIALLGHELQHAVEIADAVDVSDEKGMEALYTRIGVRGGAHIYDTLAAQEMGRRIRRELLVA
jgi:hypothetical protein